MKGLKEPMQNTSFPISALEDSEFVKDTVGDIQREQAQAQPMLDFAQDFRKQELAKVNAAARWSRKYDPDTYAKAEQLGGGIDPERGIRQMELLENNAAIAAYGDVFEKAPSMRAYFAERPKQLAKARPDELDNISGIEWITKAVPQAFEAGQTSIQAAYAANRIARGQGTIYDRAFVENYDAGRTFGADGWFSTGLVGAAQTLPQLWATLTASARASVLGGGGGAVVGTAVPGVGTGAGAVTGAGYGAIAGGYYAAWELNTGLALLEFNKFRSKDGQKLDPEVAYTAARISGALSAMLDTVGLGPAIKTVPGAQNLISGMSKEGMKTALENPGIREALFNFAKNTADIVKTETATEILQQGVQIYAGELAKANSSGEWEFKTSEERANEMLDAGVQAFQVMTLMGPFLATTRFGADLIEINRSKRMQEDLDKAIAQVDGNNLIARDPQLAADLIDQTAPDQKLYISAPELVQLFQEQGVDRYGPPLPNWRERLDNALAVGGDVEVTIGEFIAHINSDPKNQPLRDLVRTDPNGYNRAEIAEYSATLDELLLSETQKAQKAGAMPDQRATTTVDQVFPEMEQIKEQLKEIGFAQKAIDQYVTMFDAFFKTLAQRTGQSPSELFQQYGFEVQRGLFNPVQEGSLTDNVFNQSAFHGSPFIFDEFTLSKNKQGEGTNAFGYGLYFAQERRVADSYRPSTGKKSLALSSFFNTKYKGKPILQLGETDDLSIAVRAVARNMENVGFDEARTIQRGIYEEQIEKNEAKAAELGKTFLQRIKNKSDINMAKDSARRYRRYLDALNSLKFDDFATNRDGRLYTVDLPEDDVMVNWEYSIEQQPEAVKAVIEQISRELGIRITPEMGARDFYYAVARSLKSEQLASALFRDRGIPGHKFFDRFTRRGQNDKETYNFVIYDPSRIGIVSYSQDERGMITFQEEGKALISLFDSHDMSTLLHEAGHLFLNTYSKLAPSSPDLQADWELIKSKLDIEGDTITRDQHEAFARMTEAYFYAGKAPDPKLRKMFEQFRSWLKSIYRSIRKLGGSVDPEIAKVFDRMFATDNRLEEIALDNAYAPIFDSAESMGLTPEEYMSYANLVDELRADAQDTARERVVGQTARLAKGWRGEIQKQLRSEAEAKLRATAPYVHFEELKQGRIKIDREALSGAYSKDALTKFPRQALAKDGLDPELVAEMLNYPTADEMVYDFTQAAPIKEAAAAMAEQEMISRYGEDFDNSEVMDAAIKASMAQDARLTVLGTELKALSQKAGRTITDFGPRQLAKELARQSVYRRQVKDISSFKAQGAVHRAATLAQSAIVKGDWATAADWKRKQLIAQAVANEVENVGKAVTKIRDKAARYTRTASKTIHPSYMEQIRALVEQYDFAKISGKKLARRMSLREFLEDIANEGDVTIEVPERLLRDAGKVSYKELTAEDLLGLGDTLDNLEHLGRMKQKLRKAKELREFTQVKEEMLASIKQRPPVKRKMKTYTEHERSIMDYVIDFHASLLKPEQIMKFLDGDDINGPVQTHIFQPISDALAQQNELTKHYNDRIMEIFESIPAGYLTEVIQVQGFRDKMTREEIYAVALNTGNASSRKKLLEGEMWSEEQLGNVLAHMEKEDWDRVQKVWNVLDTLWPRIAQLEKRLTGVAPPKVEGRKFSTPVGDYDGGYYPVVYDFKTRRGRALIEDVTPVDKRFANGLFENSFVRPGTNHKYTTKRTKTAKPINLSLGILPAHIQTVIHDLTHREAVRDAYKLLWDPEIQQAIEDVEGHDVYVNLQNWLKAVATERHLESDPVSRRIQHLRTGMTIYGLGYRFTTILAQGLGLFPALTQINKGHLMNAVYQAAKHPKRTWDFIQATSPEMKHRMNQQDRDIRQAVQNITRKRNVKDWFVLHAFTFIGWIDRAVSTVTWMGAYEQHLASHPGERDVAARKADQAVRLTQGTGNVKDMAQIMNSKSELNRLFTMFYSGFSAQYNLQVDLYRKTKYDIEQGDWRTVALERLPQWMYLTVIPAILGAWITGDAPDEDESTARWMARKALLYPLASVPFVRDIAGSLDTGFDYKMSPVARVGESSVKAMNELLDLTREEKEFELRRFAKPAAEVSSIILQLPTGQAINTIDNLWKGLEERDLQARDLLYRRRN